MTKQFINCLQTTIERFFLFTLFFKLIINNNNNIMSINVINQAINTFIYLINLFQLFFLF